MKLQFIFILLFSQFSMLGQKIPIPKNYVIIDSIRGDLDSNNGNELVVLYNTSSKNADSENVLRELIIYKLNNKKWKKWKSSKQAVYGSKEGGIMGDPFRSIEIKNKILLINQSGGSSWKWTYTDKYCFQNGALYLIGYSSFSGRPCDYWTAIDYNLNTGRLNFKKEFENCKVTNIEEHKTVKENFLHKGIKIKLHERNKKDILIISPKLKEKIYIAIKQE
jgi:hypothetical protein